jgi:hypothetical protein
MMSATAFDGERPRQVVAFLSKPLLFSNLLAVVTRALRR